MANIQQKTDAPVGEVEQLLAFWQENGKTLMLAVAVAVTVSLGVIIVRTSIHRKSEAASTAYGLADSTEAFQDILDRYPDSQVAPLALLGLAKRYYDTMNYTYAIEKYSEFLQKYPDHPLVGTAEVGRLHSMEELGRIPEALAGYTEFAAKNPKHYLIHEVELARARCLEKMQDYEQAKKAYEDFIKKYDDSAWVAVAKYRLESVDHQVDRIRNGKGVAVLPAPTPALPEQEGQPLPFELPMVNTNVPSF